MRDAKPSFRITHLSSLCPLQRKGGGQWILTRQPALTPVSTEFVTLIKCYQKNETLSFFMVEQHLDRGR
ncbi:MAG: hypothetical protein KBT12_05575 [Bacteroidales bacterium]|nr:hypothetical protein [Candidatus Physcousia equi]